MKKVLVLGGGVAGMTAAHELAERGYRVTVVEQRKHVPGGKARTESVTAANLRTPEGFTAQAPSPDNDPLPGEHGFRFFPGFYKHVPDTMRRIPFPGNPKGVLDNLISVEEGIFAPRFKESFPTPVRFPRSPKEFLTALGMTDHLLEQGLTEDDLSFFMSKMFQIITSCKERRMHEYSRIGWWDFVDADSRSEAFQLYLATGITRNAVATQAHKANTKTIGDIGIQLILNMATPFESADRILDGPTNQMWLDPWLTHLQENLGVEYRFGVTVEDLYFEAKGGEGTISGVQISRMVNGEKREETLQADHYVMALPVEIVSKLLEREQARADAVNLKIERENEKLQQQYLKERTPLEARKLEPLKLSIMTFDRTLAGMPKLKHEVNWMTGIQFYLREEGITITPGHINCLGSPWALTALEQMQFWPSVDLKRMGDGTIRSIISVDISDWDTLGVPEGAVFDKCAKNCTEDEIAEEVWLQLKQCLNNGSDKSKWLPDTYHAYWLDSSIEQSENPSKDGQLNINLEPLLVNQVNSWDLRPEAWTRLSNFVLAGDYVRTNTDFASMEGACEAARRAINTLLLRDGYRGEMGLAKVWELEEPAAFHPLQDRDRERYNKGLPWSHPSEIPEDLVLEVHKDIHDTVEAGKEVIRSLNPLRIASELRDKIEDFVHGEDGKTVEDQARYIMQRNAGRGFKVPTTPWVAVQTWQNLLFMHHRVRKEDIAHLIHPDLEIDEFDGSAWVTLVPMYMGRMYLSVLGEIPGTCNFPEMNLRTYVRYKGRLGVWFFRIDAPSIFANWGARTFFCMPYHEARMTCHDQGNRCNMSARHHTSRGDSGVFEGSWKPKGEAKLFGDGTLEHFLGERYTAFSSLRDAEGQWEPLKRGDMIHDEWRLYEDVDLKVTENTIWEAEGIPLMKDAPEGAKFKEATRILASDGTPCVVWPFEDV